MITIERIQIPLMLV